MRAGMLRAICIFHSFASMHALSLLLQQSVGLLVLMDERSHTARFCALECRKACTCSLRGVHPLQFVFF